MGRIKFNMNSIINGTLKKIFRPKFSIVFIGLNEYSIICRYINSFDNKIIKEIYKRIIYWKDLTSHLINLIADNTAFITKQIAFIYSTNFIIIILIN